MDNDIYLYNSSGDENDSNFVSRKRVSRNRDNHNDEEVDEYANMLSDEENNESGDEDQSYYEAAEWACSYCNNDDVTAVAQCAVCKRWFCNSKCRSGSHIIQHLIYSDHKSIILHPDGLIADMGDTPLCCFNNYAHTNVFNLGTIRNNSGDYTLICRDQCLDRSRLKEIGWDADSWTHIISDRHFVDYILNNDHATGRGTISVTRKEINSLEASWKTGADVTIFDIISRKDMVHEGLEPIPSQFENSEEYRRVFIPLIELERENDKIDNASKRITDVTIRWGKGLGSSTLATFNHDQFDSRYRMNVGQSVVIHFETKIAGNIMEQKYSGKVIHIEGEEIKVLMDPCDALPTGQNSGFSISFLWNDIPYRRMRHALDLFSHPNSVSDFLYNMLLGYRIQDKPYPLLPIKSLSLPNFKRLNGSQIQAVQEALNKHLTLIQGPPGTGKTIVCSTIIYHLVNTYKQRVLVCAPSNVAVDNIVLRLSSLGLRMVRLVARSRENVSSLVEEFCLHNMAVYVGGTDSELYKLNLQLQKTGQLAAEDGKRYEILLSIAEKAILRNADVVCCTCTVGLDPRLEDIKFESVVVDETTQAREPECLIPVVRGCQRLILVGDHQQLGPVILDQEAKRAGFDVSLFERLLSLGIMPYCLNVQYRMHPALSEFPSNVFYNGTLQNGIHSSERTRLISFPWPRADMPMMFWCVQGVEDPGPSGRSLLNRMEATCVQNVVERLLECNITGDRIGVITPYDSQRTLLRQVLSRSTVKQVEMKKVEIASVDEFQGRENDYVIFSCVRSNDSGVLGFLNDLRRLNVALTRAKYGLVIIGNPNTLKYNDTWLQLMNHFQLRKCLVCGATLDNLSLYSLYLGQSGMKKSYYKQHVAQKLLENMHTREVTDSSASFGVALNDDVSNVSKNYTSSQRDDGDILSRVNDFSLNDTGF